MNVNSEGRIFALGGLKEDADFFWTNVCISFDEYGSIIDSSTNSIQGATVSTRDSKLLGNKLLSTGYADYSSEGRAGFFAVYDLECKLVEFEIIGEATELVEFASLVELSPNEYWLGGYYFIDNLGHYKPIIVAVDSTGEVLFEKKYTQFEQWSLVNSLVERDSVAKGLLTTNFIPNASENENHGDITIVDFDLEASIEISHTYDLDSIENGNDFTFDEEGNIYILYGVLNNSVQKNILKISPQNEILWTTQISHALSLGGNIVIQKDELFVSYYSEVSPNNTDAVIVKVDPLDGTVLWRRNYGGGNVEYIYDSKISDDGSIYLAGRTQSIPQDGSNFYLVKTNCMGLLTEPEAQFNFTQNNLEITFLNESQYVYPDSIDGGHYLWDFGDGQFSEDESPIHIYEEEGEYQVSLTAVVCRDTSVYKACINTYGEECDVVGSNDQIIVEAPLLYPNPSQGKINIRWSHGPGVFSFRLYNSVGVLMREDRGLNGSEMGFNLEDIESGIYLYEVERELGIWRGKVVLE